MIQDRKKAIIIGSGFGGLSRGLRLQSLGYDTTIVEKLDGPGSRANMTKVNGFTYDMGPTVRTVPHVIEERFAIERDTHNLEKPDFPTPLNQSKSDLGVATKKYAEIVPIKPFYRIYFDDKSFFDYDGDPIHTREQIKEITPDDLDGYERYPTDAESICNRRFLELG